MQSTTTAKQLLLWISVIVLTLSGQSHAQIVIGTPNLGFSQACASDAFNSYSATFIFSPEAALSPTNQFSVELSDASGDFAEAITLFTSAEGAITVSPATVTFAIPETTAGENYRIRIKSTAPAATSSGSVPFAAYYKLQDSPFTINNLVSTGAFCQGGSYLLTIDNPGTGSNDSPLNYPSLTFNWFRETGPTTSVFVAEGPSLEVSTEGTYFVETNYGTCTSNSFSNRVTITAAVSGDANASITSSLGNPYCPEQGLTTLTTLGGNAYQWFKDGVAIDGATDQTLQTNESGLFSVQVDLGNCAASGSIDLVSQLFESDINVDEVNTIEEGESLTVTVTTDATAPLFEWYYNDNLILDATDASYVASAFGEYSVVITETEGCESSVIFDFRIQEALDMFPNVNDIPNVISPNGDTINDTWIIPPQYTTGTNTEVAIYSNRGALVFKTNEYLNDWPQNDLKLSSVNQVYYYVITTSNNKTKKGSITVVR
jgi:gliding motility-associated-like protein